MSLLKIRSKQIGREVVGLRLYILFFLLLTALLLAIANSLHKESTKSIYLFSFLLTLCLAIQIQRKDKSFIYLHIANPHLEMYSEYFVLTLLFSLPVLITPHWYYFFIFQVLTALIPFISLSLSTSGSKFKDLSKVIEPSAFEYLSGFRQSFFFLIPLYILAISFAWFYVLPLVLLWIMTIMVTAFYYECEPLGVLRVKLKSPSAFLWEKILLHSKYMILLYGPVLLINAAYQGNWLINFLFLAVQLSLLFFAIVLKYSCYQPNETLTRNQIIISCVSFGAILPFLLPVPLVMSVIYFRRAVKNLNQFL